MRWRHTCLAHWRGRAGTSAAASRRSRHAVQPQLDGDQVALDATLHRHRHHVEARGDGRARRPRSPTCSSPSSPCGTFGGSLFTMALSASPPGTKNARPGLVTPSPTSSTCSIGAVRRYSSNSAWRPTQILAPVGRGDLLLGEGRAGRDETEDSGHAPARRSMGCSFRGIGECTPIAALWFNGPPGTGNPRWSSSSSEPFRSSAGISPVESSSSPTSSSSSAPTRWPGSPATPCSSGSSPPELLPYADITVFAPGRGGGGRLHPGRRAGGAAASPHREPPALRAQRARVRRPRRLDEAGLAVPRLLRLGRASSGCWRPPRAGPSPTTW